MSAIRFLEPLVELEPYDEEHVLVRAVRDDLVPVELVLEDAAIHELFRELVKMRRSS